MQTVLGEEGEVDVGDDSQPLGLPWVFDEKFGELQHFLANLSGDLASKSDFEKDAVVFEKCFGRDVRFLHSHTHDHDCSGTCVKNLNKKTQEEFAKMLKKNRAPPCHFEIFHVVPLSLEDKKIDIRRRGKEIVDTASILNTTARNRFGSVALERPEPFRTTSSDCSLAPLR